jgi:RNA-directed DNA polymerase
MLTALEEGVKGGRWYSLMDKVYASATLRAAFGNVRANGGAAGVDHVTVADFEQHLDANLRALGEGLRSGTYRPQAIRRVEIPKAGTRKETRPLGIPTVRDRVAQAALRHVLEPIFERDFAAGSYGFRPNRSAKDGLRRVAALLESGHGWVVDADLRKYFDTIPPARLLAAVEGKVADGRVLALLRGYLTQAVLAGAARWTPERGTPQGAVISPLLANIYLDPLDHRMAGAGYEMVRYADDFVILCRSRGEAEAALEAVQAWVADADLTLHPEKTRIVEATQTGGFDFLGYHFERGRRWPSRRSLGRFQEALRVRTKRTSGQSLEAIIAGLIPMLRGWFEYFKHSRPYTFERLDAWLRMRLRSLLRRRLGGRGRGRGADHHRWPNSFFAAHGLYSLTAAYVAAGQPSRR